MSAARAALLVALAGLALGATGGWLAADGALAPETPTGADRADLGERMADALRRVDPVAQRRALLTVLAEMRPDTIEALREGFEREIRFADRCVTGLFAAAWARFDAPGAFAASTRWENALQRSHATSEIAYALALAGRHEEARALADTLTLSRVRNPTLAGLAEGLVRSGDVDTAMTYLLEQADSAERNRLIESFLRSFLLRGDLEGALAWADAIPVDAPRRLKRTAFALTARWVSGVDPPRAAAWYDAQPEGADYTRLAHLSVAEEWIEHDPEAALAWVVERTPVEDRANDMGRVLRRLVDRDPAAAAAWMDRQESPDAVAPGIPPLVAALEHERPEEALAWAERVGNPELRERLLVRVAAQWLAREPDAARHWLDAHVASDALRARIEEEARS